MRARLTRLGLVAGGLLALLGTTTPPAQAQTVIETAFVATAQIAGGLGYPLPPPAGNLPTPTVPTTQCLPLNGTVTSAVPNCHVDYGNRNNVTVQAGGPFGGVCMDTTTNIAKGSLPPIHTGPCVFNVAGYVTGHCGLSGGQVTGTYTDSLGQTYSIDIHFNGIGGTVEFVGHARKATTHQGTPQQHGLIVGDTAAIPPTPVTSAESCTAGTATTFTLAGAATSATDPTL